MSQVDVWIDDHEATPQGSYVVTWHLQYRHEHGPDGIGRSPPVTTEVIAFPLSGVTRVDFVRRKWDGTVRFDELPGYVGRALASYLGTVMEIEVRYG